jgi:hypothetical protein
MVGLRDMAWFPVWLTQLISRHFVPSCLNGSKPFDFLNNNQMRLPFNFWPSFFRHLNDFSFKCPVFECSLYLAVTNLPTCLLPWCMFMNVFLVNLTFNLRSWNGRICGLFIQRTRWWGFSLKVENQPENPIRSHLKNQKIRFLMPICSWKDRPSWALSLFDKNLVPLTQIWLYKVSAF